MSTSRQIFKEYISRRTLRTAYQKECARETWYYYKKQREMASKVCHLILLVCFLVNTNGLSLRPPGQLIKFVKLFCPYTSLMKSMSFTVKNCPRKLYCGYAAPCDTATCPKQTGARCYNDYCSNGCGKARFLDPYYNEVDCKTFFLSVTCGIPMLFYT